MAVEEVLLVTSAEFDAVTLPVGSGVGVGDGTVVGARDCVDEDVSEAGVGEGDGAVVEIGVGDGLELGSIVGVGVEDGLSVDVTTCA